MVITKKTADKDTEATEITLPEMPQQRKSNLVIFMAVVCTGGLVSGFCIPSAN
jgi:hypothetical protein